MEKFEIDYANQFIKFPKFHLIRNNFPIKIIGQNGSGKTSLILSLAGVIPDFIYGKPKVDLKITSNQGEINFPYNQKLFRIIPQRWKYAILGFYPMEEIELIKTHNDKWKKELLNIFEIERLNKISSIYLSDGEKKRIILCKTLCSLPPLIISDEWTTHLDDYWIKQTESLFKDYYHRGGLHLEFHSNDLNGYGLLLETKKTNSEYLRVNPIDYCFVQKYIEVSFKSKNINYTQKVKYYGNYQNKSLDISFHNGELILLIGQNGSGKTTLLKNLWKDSYYFHRKLIKNNFSIPKILFVPADPTYHIMGPTIKDEYERILGDYLKSSSKSFFENLLGIDSTQDVLGLSYGQRKVLAIVLGLLSEYPIICIDEPYAGLDNSNQSIISEFFRIALKTGKTILLADQTDKYKMHSTLYQI